jgi:hypothetical protein
MIGALVFSRVDGYVDAYPGMRCILKCRNLHIRVRVTKVVANGKLEIVWPLEMQTRPSGWPRVRAITRAGRLQVVD